MFEPLSVMQKCAWKSQMTYKRLPMLFSAGMMDLIVLKTQVASKGVEDDIRLGFAITTIFGGEQTSPIFRNGGKTLQVRRLFRKQFFCLFTNYSQEKFAKITLQKCYD